MTHNSKKILGFWTLISLVVGNIIGSGVFLLPSSLAKYGSISVFGWILTSCGAICVAMVFANLSSIYPKTGGPYVYCHEAFGDFFGFQIAYNYWISLWVANAALVVALVGYLGFFWPTLAHNHGIAFLISTAILWFVTLINIIGLREMGFVQILTTILKIIPLIVIVTIGFFYIHPHYLTTTFNISHHSNFSALNATVTLTLWAFLGLESATVPADNVKNPVKNIPRATILGTSIAAIIYIGGTIVIMGIVPMHTLALSNSPFADAAYMIFGNWGGSLVALTAIIASFGALNGLILLQGQIPLAAARDKLFPEKFASTSKNDIPIFGLIVSSILINILLAMSFNQNLVSQFTLIILLATLANIIPYFYTCMAEIIILLKQKEKYPQRKLAKHIWIACLAFIFTAWAIIGSGATIIFYGAILIFSSAPIYVWMKWKQGSQKTV